MPNKPWENEPNELKWVDEATGLMCLILRAPEMGHLCGYVRIPRRHALYSLKRPCSYRLTGSSRAESTIRVHGGVTFSGVMRRLGGGWRRGRWIGFDCAHAWDLMPGFPSWETDERSYRDIAYVTGQVEQMARQVKAMVK